MGGSEDCGCSDAKLLKRGLSFVDLSMGRSCVRLVWGLGGVGDWRGGESREERVVGRRSVLRVVALRSQL